MAFLLLHNYTDFIEKINLYSYTKEGVGKKVLATLVKK